jgi:hypothetical protein
VVISPSKWAGQLKFFIQNFGHIEREVSGYEAKLRLNSLAGLLAAISV